MKHRTARACILLLVSVLLIFGIVMLYSTSFAAYGEFYLKRQLMWAVAGSCAALAVAFVDYRRLDRYGWVPMCLVGAGLTYLAFAFFLYRLPFIPHSLVTKLPMISGPTKGSFRWLHFGSFSVQPSEFAKPALILYLATYYGRRARYVLEFKRGFLRPIFISGAILALIFLGKDLSTTVITGAIVFVMMFVAGVRVRYLLLLVVLGTAFVTAALVMSPMRLKRLTAFLHPEQYQRGEGYQLWHSQLALGSGGLTGVGFTRSRMKQHYLPEAHTDFIVAIVGEELGFVAVAGLILVYCLLVGAILWTGALSRERAGVLLCVGVALSIGLQAFINISVVSGFCPTTGVTAPFLSYGGSSMLGLLMSVGLVLNVSFVSENNEVEEAMESQYSPALAPREAEQLAARLRKRR